MNENKAKYKLKGFPKVLWLNLERYTRRREYMEKQLKYWGIEDHIRIQGIDGKQDDITSYLKGEFPSIVNQNEIGCVLAHLNAIKYFVEETNLDEIMIMEDDVDLSTAQNWSFTYQDIRSRLPINLDVVQFTIINPRGISLKLHARFINDFSAACYLITRHHGTKLLKLHKRDHLWKIDQNIKPRAVSEDLILDSGKAYSLPIFSFRIDLGSAIHPEHIDLYHKDSCIAINEFWKHQGSKVKVNELMELDVYAGRMHSQVYIDWANKNTN